MIMTMRLCLSLSVTLIVFVVHLNLSEAQTPPEIPSWKADYERPLYPDDLRLPYPPTLPYPNISPPLEFRSVPYYPYYPPPSDYCPPPCYPPAPSYPYYPPKPHYHGYFSERGLYSYGLNLVYSKKCREAIRVFRDFLSFYPRSSLADNAVYWTGECYYYMKNYHQAIREFDKVIRRYPRGNKVPDAMLKKGYSYLSLGRYDTAFRILEDLIYRYPRSRPAQLARTTLGRYRYAPYFPPYYCRPCSPVAYDP